MPNWEPWRKKLSKRREKKEVIGFNVAGTKFATGGLSLIRSLNNLCELAMPITPEPLATNYRDCRQRFEMQVHLFSHPDPADIQHRLD
jgi:hypothetical protein